MAIERLQRTLARAGLSSRRGSEELIKAGRVEINGRPASLGDKVDPEQDEVRVDGRRVSVDPGLRYVALHKPKGVTTTMRDRHAERDLRDYLPEGPRVFPVGRLDRDTEGLLLLTNDGDLAHRLAHPRHGVEKEYLAEVDGSPTPARIGKLRRGVELDDGIAKAVDARSVGRAGGRFAVRVVMTEGRKREVRRMCEQVGHPVEKLGRVALGPLKLGKLPPGEHRVLSDREVVALRRAVGLR